MASKSAVELDNNYRSYEVDDDADTFKKTNTTVSEIEGAGDGTKACDHYLSGVPLYTCMASLTITMFLVALDQTIVATILTEVGDKFHAFGKVNWISSAFMLPMAVLSLSWGKFSVIIGRKYGILLAIVFFEVGSLICALANSMDMLIGGRVIAGIGASGIQVLVLIIISEIVPIQKRGLAQGMIGAAFGFASVIGPLVGGSFASYVSWRWCFYINLPFGAIAFAAMYFYFKPPKPTGSVIAKLKKIDYVGTAFLTIFLVLVLLALTFGSTDNNWKAPIVISFFVVGGLFGIFFFAWNFCFSHDPLVPWHVIKIRPVWSASFAFFFFYGAFMCNILYTTIYFQVVKNLDPFHSGIRLLPLIIPVIILSITVGALISITRYIKPFLIIGSTIGTVGYGVQSLFDVDTSVGITIGILIVSGTGIGFMFQSCIMSVQIEAPKANGGVIIATAIASTTRQVGGIFGSALGQTIMSIVFTRKVLQTPDVPASIKDEITTLINSPPTIYRLPEDLRRSILQSFVYGYRDTVYFGTALFACCFLISFLTTGARIPKKVKPTSDDKVADGNKSNLENYKQKN
jgi:MFS family permease